MNKEHNFVSAVVYIEDGGKETLGFLRALSSCLDKHFLQYEIVVVNTVGEQGNIRALKEWAKDVSQPMTMVNMSARQPHEQCMNAGLDITIGDYILSMNLMPLS